MFRMFLDQPNGKFTWTLSRHVGQLKSPTSAPLVLEVSAPTPHEAVQLGGFACGGRGRLLQD
jgi:hypothetical protein